MAIFEERSLPRRVHPATHLADHTTGDCWLKHQEKWDNNPDLTTSNLVGLAVLVQYNCPVMTHLYGIASGAHKFRWVGCCTIIVRTPLLVHLNRVPCYPQEINHKGAFTAEFRAVHKTSPEMVRSKCGCLVEHLQHEARCPG